MGGRRPVEANWKRFQLSSRDKCLSIEAAMEAERMHKQTLNEQRRVVELELVQARYETTLAERG